MMEKRSNALLALSSIIRPLTSSTVHGVAMLVLLTKEKL
jgi:hypothetical protein